jgi:hypothetical protein
MNIHENKNDNHRNAKNCSLAADAAVSAAEAKQYMLEAEQGYQDTSAAAQQAQDAAGSALLSKQSAATSEENSPQYATEAGVARDEAVASHQPPQSLVTTN